MSETIKTTQHFYTKEFGSYSNTENNFVANQELTVTITLNEYRKLIEGDAKSSQKVDDANKDRWKREEEVKSLKLEISNLKEKLYESSVAKNADEDNQNGDVE